MNRAQCAGNDTSISQFIVDCGTTNVIPIVFPLSGLSIPDRIVVGVGVPVCSLPLAAIAGCLFIRWRWRKVAAD